jgi:hypothetical protein
VADDITVTDDVTVGDDLTVTDQILAAGHISTTVAGKGFRIKEGANARMGTLTLTGATPVVVSNTSVTATTRIFLTHNTPGGTPAFCWVSDRTASTSFSVTGTASDTSVVAYVLIEPAA